MRTLRPGTALLLSTLGAGCLGPPRVAELATDAIAPDIEALQAELATLRAELQRVERSS